MECNKCTLAIDRKNDRYTICEEKCAKRFHASCVGLAEPTMCALFTKNILWMCDTCLDHYCATRDADNSISAEIDDDATRPNNQIESDIADLKAKVEEIFDTLATLGPHHQMQLSEKLHSTAVSSSPKASTYLLDGTKTSRTARETSEIANHTCKRNDTFSLFLTHIDCRATNEDVIQLVCECLDISDRRTVKIRKLLPKGCSMDDLDYISFKVALDSKHKCLAMDQSTWPVGLKYREFENRFTVWAPE